MQVSAAPQARPEPADPLLRVSGLAARFGAVHALDGVDLTVAPGELVALAGENGAGKTTLVRCIAGDIAASSGRITLAGRVAGSGPADAARAGVAVVWQDLALCDNLDIAANLLLGRERRRHLLFGTRFHASAAELLAGLGIGLTDTTRNVRTLSGGQRQLLAVARAMIREPQLLLLDEPTASLGVQESRQVEELITRLHGQGTTIMIACHDIDQMFRLADRIVVLRQGRVVGDLRPDEAHPDDVLALISGQQVSSSARGQLTRLHGLADRLVSADPSSSLSLILSALGAALSADRLCIHLATEDGLVCAASLGLPPPLARGLGPAARGPGRRPGRPGRRHRRAGHPGQRAARRGVGAVRRPGQCGQGGQLLVGAGARARRAGRGDHRVPAGHRAAAAGPAGPGHAVRRVRGQRDRAGPAAGPGHGAEPAAGNDQGDAGDAGRPGPGGRRPVLAVQALRRGLQAHDVALVIGGRDGSLECRGAGRLARLGPSVRPAPGLLSRAAHVLAAAGQDGQARPAPAGPGELVLAVTFAAPGGPAALLARWRGGKMTADGTALMEDAAHSLQLALEREEAWPGPPGSRGAAPVAGLQRDFLSRLSHELRTPLTAIKGYASSLMQTDVTWDGESQQRFLARIGAESARLGRLVDDLLNFSAIESGVLRLQRTGATWAWSWTRPSPACRRTPRPPSRSPPTPACPRSGPTTTGWSRSS